MMTAMDQMDSMFERLRKSSTESLERLSEKANLSMPLSGIMR